MKQILLSALIVVGVSAFSQNKLSLNDSLAGFDEQSYIISASQKGTTPEELSSYITYQKRAFINNKYGLKSVEFIDNTDYKTLASNCLNEDFENSSPSTPWPVPSTNSITTSAGIVGWTGSKASAASGGTLSSCSLTFCCSGNPDDIQIIAPGPGGLIDPIVGGTYPIFSLFGDSLNNGVSTYSINSRGDFFAKINNSAPGAKVRRLTKSINVTSTNSLFQFGYMSIVQAAHCCCDNGGVTIRFRDCSNNLLSLPVFSVTPPQGVGCAGGSMPCISAGNPIALISSSVSAWFYSKWTISSVDLSPYIGNCVKAEVIAYGCPYTGHGAYAYFDAHCDTMHVLNNSKKMGANTSSVTVYGCASVTNTLSAPDGFSPYQWQGPVGFTTSTLQTISTNIPGTYTLTMGGFASFAPTIKYITLNHGPIPITTSSSHSILCIGDSAQLTASGVGSYTWSTGATSSSIYVKPTTNTTYTVNVNYQGCPGSATITQSVAVCTGLNSINGTELVSIYPNPNKGDFTIKLNRNLISGKLELMSILGQIVFVQSIKQGNNSIRTEQLPKGVYAYIITDNDKLVQTGKIAIE